LVFGCVGCGRTFVSISPSDHDGELKIKGKSRKLFGRDLGGHQGFLIGEVRWGPSIGDKGQLEVVDDSVHDGLVGEESNDPYLAFAFSKTP